MNISDIVYSIFRHIALAEGFRKLAHHAWVSADVVVRAFVPILHSLANEVFVKVMFNDRVGVFLHLLFFLQVESWRRLRIVLF